MKKINRSSMLKIISTFLAIFLWLYVRGEVDPERTVTYRDIPVRFENLAEVKDHNLAVVSNMDYKVEVTLSGKMSDMSRVIKDNVYATVDLSGYSEGELSIPVKIYVDNGENVKVVNRKPSRVNVHIDEILEHEMEVNILTTGQLEDTYTLGMVKPSEEVVVKGASSRLDSIEKIVAKVDVTGMSESAIKTGEVIAYDKDENEIKGVTITPSTVDIEVPVLKTLTVPIRLNISGTLPEGVSVQNFSVEPSSVMVRGNSAIINKITEINSKPINVDQLMGTRSEVSLILPDGVSLVDKNLKVVASSDELIPKKMSFIFSKDEIKIENLEKYDVEILTESVNVDCIQKNLLEDYEITKEEITMTLDVKDLEIGIHEIAPKIDVAEQYSVEKITPELIKIEVKKKGIFN